MTLERYQSEVFFLDHGDTEWVPNNMVQLIDPSLLNASGLTKFATLHDYTLWAVVYSFQHLLLSFDSKQTKLTSALEHHSLDST